MMKPSHKEIHFFRIFSCTDTYPDVPKCALHVSCFAECAWDLSAADGCTESCFGYWVQHPLRGLHRELLFSPCLVSAQHTLNILAPLKTTEVQSTNTFNLLMGEVF